MVFRIGLLKPGWPDCYIHVSWSASVCDFLGSLITNAYLYKYIKIKINYDCLKSNNLCIVIFLAAKFLIFFFLLNLCNNRYFLFFCSKCCLKTFFFKLPRHHISEYYSSPIRFATTVIVPVAGKPKIKLHAFFSQWEQYCWQSLPSFGYLHWLYHLFHSNQSDNLLKNNDHFTNN